MAKKEVKDGYMIPKKAGAYAEALSLLQEYRSNLFDAYNKAFGEWDGFYSRRGETPSEREVEQKVLDRVLAPVEEYFKQRLAEEVATYL